MKSLDGVKGTVVSLMKQIEKIDGSIKFECCDSRDKTILDIETIKLFETEFKSEEYRIKIKDEKVIIHFNGINIYKQV